MKKKREKEKKEGRRIGYAFILIVTRRKFYLFICVKLFMIKPLAF